MMRPPWDPLYWKQFEAETLAAAMGCGSDTESWQAVAARCRVVLRTYSTSFFLVTRFLPPAKRARVEVIYAAVRYPDEVVDSFPIGASNQISELDRWQTAYGQAIAFSGVRTRLQAGVPTVLAAFAQVVQDCKIPEEHYHSFLDAMRLDAAPRPFSSLDDLIGHYIYGSAIVVGYFLAHVYGPSRPAEFSRALHASRELGIALQLTNFLRDIGEDQRRGRVYLPSDLLAREGISQLDVSDTEQLPRLGRVLQ
ncbi:MAG: phytoene/squalene synthase family protein, partial [Acidobacteriota bacterium]|nr:phytoene/squalene synthase family protein [Acidobacteriota bacterium]